jgi:hypothetical protein
LAEIIGHVDARNRPIVSLSIPGEDDDLPVVVDTGFNRELLIDEVHIARLKCEITQVAEPVEFANRERRRLLLARSQIIWFGRLREVYILIAPTQGSRAAMADEPIGLLGAGLLSPHKLIVDFTSRRVLISETQNSRA